MTPTVAAQPQCRCQTSRAICADYTRRVASRSPPPVAAWRSQATREQRLDWGNELRAVCAHGNLEMTADRAVATRSTTDVPSDEDAQELADYCSRPLCRREFRRGAVRGRRRAYCSEVCRRQAEKELRQTRSRLAHFECVVEQLRVDVLAFGRPGGDEAAEQDQGLDVRRRAEDAATRAAGVLAFLADSGAPLARELAALHDAVSPLLTVR